jgi:hypothetical protein
MTAMTTSEPKRLDARMRAAIIAVAVVGGAFTAFAAAMFSLAIAFSVGVGAIIATANLWILARIMNALLPGDSDSAPAGSGQKNQSSGWAFVALLKMLGLFAGVWILMSKHLVEPLPLLCGFGALPIGIAIGSIVSDRTASRKK